MKERRRTIRIMPGDLRAMASASQFVAWRPYLYRDPARCSPERLAELAAHDEHIKRLNFMLRGDPNSKRNGDREMASSD